jgi:transposase
VGALRVKEREEVPRMSIVGALDIHRGQITFECLDTSTDELRRGRILEADRPRFREWLVSEFGGRQDVAMALEGCTGWRYVVEELRAAGIEAHLADPAEVQARRGRKRRAKTDRSDARLQRELLMRGELPESWIPPAHVLEMRALVRTYKDLLDTRTAWQQRMQAVLFHHGVPEVKRLAAPDVRSWLTGEDVALSPAGRRQITVGYAVMDALNAELLPLRAELAAFGRRQRGCRALLKAHYGVGALIATCVWAELGDCRRFSNSGQVVRHTGLDITVYSSDDKRSPGRLARQGPAVLRWALFEAGKCAARPTSPDYAYYQAVKARHDGTRAALSVARCLARRCYHTLRQLGDEALAAPSA